ncbi:MAG TPA: hypothetical protein VMA95_11860 [Streptosporangiaceae bacterium]|nr:hypothetical protein [Streptosporangiaceae bacterium]
MKRFALAVVLTAFAVSACGAGHTAAPPARKAATATVRKQTPSPTPSPTPKPTPADQPLPVAPGAGARHQTMARPRTGGRAWHAMVTDLWLAVKTGKAGLGRQAFFPVAAYKQVKAIADPAADWKARLWGDFVLDVHAAHALLGHGAKKAALVKVLMAPAADDAWIDPGVCYNSIGYWHIANARVVYREHGQVRSFGIASLISWRGVWYVVHFGGVVRPAVGMTDAPATGTGYVGPQGGC